MRMRQLPQCSSCPPSALLGAKLWRGRGSGDSASFVVTAPPPPTGSDASRGKRAAASCSTTARDSRIRAALAGSYRFGELATAVKVAIPACRGAHESGISSSTASSTSVACLVADLLSRLAAGPGGLAHRVPCCSTGGGRLMRAAAARGPPPRSACFSFFFFFFYIFGG